MLSHPCKRLQGTRGSRVSFCSQLGQETGAEVLSHPWGRLQGTRGSSEWPWLQRVALALGGEVALVLERGRCVTLGFGDLR